MRYGDKIFWCRRLDESDTQDTEETEEVDEKLQEFAAPAEIPLVVGKFSLQPASGYSALQQFGNNVNLYQTIICQPYEKWFGVFKEGDRFYVDGRVPSEDEEFYGQLANFVVDSVSNQNVAIRVVLKRI